MEEYILSKKEDWTAVADLIRTKNNISKKLSFPNDFLYELNEMGRVPEGFEIALIGEDILFGNDDTSAYAERYAIKSEDLNAIGELVQKMAGKSALMSINDMIYWLNRVQFIPQGNAENEFSLSFNSAASGILPNVQRGSATSVFSLSFASTAVGELVEVEEE